MKFKVLLAATVTLAYLATLPGVGVGIDQWGKVWTIAVGHDWGAQEYIDTDGYIRGFTRDLIAAVCEAGNMQCRTIWDKYTNCWNSDAGQHSFGGEGLMSGWYDACTGWVGSTNRMQVFDFSLPFFQPSQAFFYVKRGRTLDPYNIKNLRKIGFLDGWVSDEKCLARQTMVEGNVLPKEKIIHFLTTDEIHDALVGGEIDAIFAGDYTWSSDEIVKAGNVYFTCSSSGNAMMTRKDNEFNQNWNMGFQQIVASGQFSKLCKEAADKYSHVGELTPCV